MNKSKIKEIRRFAKRRFPDKPWRTMEKILRKNYENSSPKVRESADEEMARYFKALDKGLIKKGETIVRSSKPVGV